MAPIDANANATVVVIEGLSENFEKLLKQFEGSNVEAYNAGTTAYLQSLAAVTGTIGLVVAIAYRAALAKAVSRIFAGKGKREDGNALATALNELGESQRAALIAAITNQSENTDKHPHIAQGAKYLLESINRSRDPSPASSHGGEGPSNTGPQPSGGPDKPRGRPPGPKKSDGKEQEKPELTFSPPSTTSTESSKDRKPGLLNAPNRDHSPAGKKTNLNGVAQKLGGKKDGSVVPVEPGKKSGKRV